MTRGLEGSLLFCSLNLLIPGRHRPRATILLEEGLSHSGVPGRARPASGVSPGRACPLRGQMPHSAVLILNQSVLDLFNQKQLLYFKTYKPASHPALPSLGCVYSRDPLLPRRRDRRFPCDNSVPVLCALTLGRGRWQADPGVAQ